MIEVELLYLVKNTTSSPYGSTIKASIVALNNSIPSCINVYKNKKSSNIIYSKNYASSWIWFYSYYTKNSKNYKFDIYLNNILLTSKYNNYKQSTLVHKIWYSLSMEYYYYKFPSIVR